MFLAALDDIEGVCTVVGAATTNFITIPVGTVEYVEKKSLPMFVMCTGTIRAAKVSRIHKYNLLED